jgi:biuret amidohydrolase
MSSTLARRPALAEMIDPKRTALVVIDVQADFGSPDGLYGRVGCDLSRVEPAIDRMMDLHDAATCAGVLTIFVRLETGPETDSLRAQERRVRNGTNTGGRPCVAGTPGADYYRVAPRAGDQEVVKHRYSTFTNTSMEFVLKARPSIDTLVICGLTTECCVDTAVRDAFVRDYHLFLPRDASASYRVDMHDTTFDIFAQYFATITTTADVTQAWVR